MLNLRIVSNRVGCLTLRANGINIGQIYTIFRQECDCSLFLNPFNCIFMLLRLNDNCDCDTGNSWFTNIFQVRGICVCSDDNIATSSRDRTIRVWSLDPSDKRKYTSSKILLGHTSFVGPLAWIPPTDEYPEGRLVSGSMDTFVFVWNLINGENIQTLKGHQMQVTGVAIDKEDIVSSSVDQ